MELPNTARTAVTLINLMDVGASRRDPEEARPIRCIHLHDVLVDSTASGVRLPAVVIEQLNLFTLPDGSLSPVRVAIGGRSAPIDPIRSADGRGVVLGRLVLAALDLVIGPDGRLVEDPRGTWPGFTIWAGGLLDVDDAAG